MIILGCFGGTTIYGNTHIGALELVEVHWSDGCVRADGGEGSRMYKAGEKLWLVDLPPLINTQNMKIGKL